MGGGGWDRLKGKRSGEGVSVELHEGEQDDDDDDVVGRSFILGADVARQTDE